LSACGLAHIEVGSFVSPRRVPQLAETDAVCTNITLEQGYTALIANQQGLQRALACGLKRVALVTAVSATFCEQNLGCSAQTAVQRVQAINAMAKGHGLWVRVYVSCAFYCPFEGEVSQTAVLQLLQRLVAMGCDEIVLSDTTGEATADRVTGLLQACQALLPVERIAVHFHDTYGQALANLLAALQAGVQVVDSAVAGLGGCPFAPGAGGNAATEDVVYLLQHMGIQTGINLAQLIPVGQAMVQRLRVMNRSKVALALQRRATGGA